MTKMTINEMLREAITTESRKRKCRWQTELEALGFEISKDGAWFIRYTKTNRFIELPYNESYIRTNNGYIKFHGYTNKSLLSVDLEGLLTKRPVKAHKINYTDVDRMKNALHNRKYHSRILDNAMNEYRQTIDILTKEYQKRLEDAKHSYDWKMDYHRRSLENANEIISNLLLDK